MEYKRIKRLLRSEYRQLAQEKIILESPFAETTKDGEGLREVALGLTSRSLIVATDVIHDKSTRKFWCLPGDDPSIETLELLSVYPLKFITLSVFRRKYRKVLKARLVNGRAQFYELGGMKHRETYWTFWCDHVRELMKTRRLGSSLSETTAAISSTCSSTVYLYKNFEQGVANGHSRKKRKRTDRTRCASGGGADDSINPTWTSKHLYLGPSYEELHNGSYAPVPLKFSEASLDEVRNEVEGFSQSSCKSKYKCMKLSLDSNACNHRKRHQYVNECSNKLFTQKNGDRYNERPLIPVSTENSSQERNFNMLFNFQPIPPLQGRRSRTILDLEDPQSEFSCSTCNCHKRTAETIAVTSKSNQRFKKIGSYAAKFIRKLSRFRLRSEENTCKSSLVLKSSSTSYYRIQESRKMIDNAVAVWENYGKSYSLKTKRRLRKYAISPATYFLYALGPWSVQPGDRESVQSLRSHSCVAIRRQPADPEFQLPISRRQLAASISLTDLTCGMKASTRGHVVLFWTPDYWYRPRAAIDAYKEIRKHLEQLKTFRVEKELKRVGHGVLRNRAWAQLQKSRSSDVCSQPTDSTSRSTLNLSNSQAPCDKCKHNQQRAATIGHLRKLLKLDFRVTLWDLDSTTLAQQLTLIDVELFLRVPRREFEIVLKQRTSRDAPNLGAWIAFAHRVACLTASEVLAVTELDMRARLIARLLNSAEKCYLIGNFQSTRSIIAGLQTPALYRLRDSWEYLKVHHFTTYEIMEKLSKVFTSTRTKRYHNAWSRVERNPPSMPFVGHVLTKALGLDKSTKADKTCSSRMSNRASRERDREGREAIGDWLEDRQRSAYGYEFPGDSLAWEFLLKARYREDRDNFLASHELEPPPHC